MPKCGGCGKFIAVSDSIKCPKCPVSYHRICVNLSASATIAPNWMCPGCKVKQPRTDNSQTPVKAAEDNSTFPTQSVTQAASPTLPAVKQTVARTNLQAVTQAVMATPLQAVAQVPSHTVANTVPISAISGITATQEVSLAMEIRCLRDEVNALRAEVRDFREEMTGIKSTVQAYSNKVDALEDRVNLIEEKFDQTDSPRLAELESTIGELKQQLNERDQESMLNDIQLSGITEIKGENPTQLLNTLALKLGTPLDERDVIFVKRVGNILRDRTEGEDAARPRTIIVRLARRGTRDSILSAARVRRNLTTADIQVPGTARRIYVNERLTKRNRQLFYLTRQAASRLEWKYTWTKDGCILARKEEGKSVVHIRQENDITRFFGDQ